MWGLKQIAVVIFVTAGILFTLTGVKSQTPVTATEGEFPFQVTVQFHNDFWGSYESSASGAILDETHVLTVRQSWPVEDLSIGSGVTHLTDLITGAGGTRHQIKQIIIHPNYTTCYNSVKPNPNDPILNNLWIIEVVEPFVFSDLVRPVKLPSKDFIPPEGESELSAWRSAGFFDDGINKIAIPIINRTACEDFYGRYKIHDGTFCAAFITDGESVDRADDFEPGGLLMCREDPDDPDSLVLCGLKGYTPVLNYFCDEPGESVEVEKKVRNLQDPAFPTYPMTFTQISYYLDWIAQTIAKK